MRKRALSQYVALFATIALLAVTSIAPAAAANLLFYNQNTGAAVIGTVRSYSGNPDSRSLDGRYSDLKTLAFDRGWKNIVSTSDGTLLFYNPGTGLAASGRVAADGTFTDLKTMNLSPGWSHIVRLRQGKLLFYQTTTGLMSTGVLSTDGAHRDLKDISGIDPGWDVIVEIGGDVLLFHKANTGEVALGRINPDGSFVPGGSATWASSWTHITLIAADVLLFYNAKSGSAGMSILTGRTVGSPKAIGSVSGTTHQVLASNGVILFYRSSPSRERSVNLYTHQLFFEYHESKPPSRRLGLLQSQVITPNWSHLVALP